MVWTDGCAFHKEAPLVAAAEAGIDFAGKSKANTNFALHAQGGMTNQRGALEACAAVLMARDCKLEVRLDNMWVKTGVEQMLSWIERKKQPTFRSERTLCVESDMGETLANPKRPCHAQTCPSSS